MQGRGARYRSIESHYREPSAAGPLLALALVLAVPALLIALAAGWRPLDTAQSEALLGRLGTLVGREPPAARAAAPGDHGLPNGWFFARAAPAPGESAAMGFAVTDAEGVPFWSEFNRLGKEGYLGYPLSRRYTADGATYQLFQRALLRYHPTSGVTVVPLLDELHAAGHDPALAEGWAIPEVELPIPGATTPELIAERVGWLLQDYPAMREFLAAAPDGGAWLGAPTSGVRDVGSHYVVRFQGGALLQWKEDQPWARVGDVTLHNVGDIAAALDYPPAESLAPRAPTG